MNALPENSSGKEFCSIFRRALPNKRPKGLYGGPLILQREPFLPKAKLAGEKEWTIGPKTVIERTVNLGIQRFCAPHSNAVKTGWLGS